MKYVNRHPQLRLKKSFIFIQWKMETKIDVTRSWLERQDDGPEKYGCKPYLLYTAKDNQSPFLELKCEDYPIENYDDLQIDSRGYTILPTSSCNPGPKTFYQRYRKKSKMSYLSSTIKNKSPVQRNPAPRCFDVIEGVTFSNKAVHFVDFVFNGQNVTVLSKHTNDNETFVKCPFLIHFSSIPFVSVDVEFRDKDGRCLGLDPVVFDFIGGFLKDFEDITISGTISFESDLYGSACAKYANGLLGIEYFEQ